MNIAAGIIRQHLRIYVSAQGLAFLFAVNPRQTGRNAPAELKFCPHDASRVGACTLARLAYGLPIHITSNRKVRPKFTERAARGLESHNGENRVLPKPLFR